MPRGKSLPETWRECHGIVLELTLENFAPHPTGRNGWQPRCRECMREYKRANRKMSHVPRPVALLKPGQICPECFDLPHRRPLTGCWRCEQPYAPEPPVELVTHRSYERAV